MALAGNAILGFGSGVLSTLSPCILPLLPIVLASALGRHRLAPIALAGGVALSFSAIGIAFASLGFASGIDGETIRIAAAVLIIGFGALLLAPRLYERVGGALSQASGRLAAVSARISPEGAGGQLVVGLVLGAVWAPCAGPTLGAAIGLAAQGDSAAGAGVVMAAFGLGAATPLVALGYGSRRAITARKQILSGVARFVKPAMGAALVAVGLLIVTGADKIVEARLTDAMPASLVEFTTRFLRVPHLILVAHGGNVMKTLKQKLIAASGALAVGSLVAAAPVAASAQTAKPCAPKAAGAKAGNPCAAKGNPCAAKSNPCAAKAKNPCAAKGNPCAAKKM